MLDIIKSLYGNSQIEYKCIGQNDHVSGKIKEINQATKTLEIIIFFVNCQIERFSQVYLLKCPCPREIKEKY